MITVAQSVVRALESEGVSVVFGYPGATICPFYDALAQSSIRHVLVRQEQMAAHAASGYARISGKPGVAIATSGPGAVNLLTGLATAYMDSIPLVAITGQVPCDQIGHDVFQEADITGAAEPFTKYAYLVKDPSQIGRIIKEAFYIAASGRPGPVVIDLPIDIQQSKIDFIYPETVSIRGYKPTYAGNALQVRRVVQALEEAKRPLICVGGGVLSAAAGGLVCDFAGQCGLPMVSTMMGISAIASDHPLYYGMLGSYGCSGANWAVNHADLILIMGARVGDRAMQSPAILEKRARIVHIDVDPAEIGKNVGTSIPLVGDVKNIVQQLLRSAKPVDSAQWVRILNDIRAQEQTKVSSIQRAVQTVDPKQVLHTLSDLLDPDAVVAADVGQNQIWAARNMHFLKGGRFITSGGMGTMGYALGAAIGGKIASYPGRQTVVVCGDGGLQMSMMELATLCQENLDLKILVMCNRRLGMIAELQKQHYQNRQTAVILNGDPDWVALAGAYHIASTRLNREDEILPALKTMLETPGPYLLECVVDPEEPSIS